jgi:hypothetical protein
MAAATSPDPDGRDQLAPVPRHRDRLAAEQLDQAATLAQHVGAAQDRVLQPGGGDHALHLRLGGQVGAGLGGGGRPHRRRGADHQPADPGRFGRGQEHPGRVDHRRVRVLARPGPQPAGQRAGGEHALHGRPQAVRVGGVQQRHLGPQAPQVADLGRVADHGADVLDALAQERGHRRPADQAAGAGHQDRHSSPPHLDTTFATVGNDRVGPSVR